MVSIDRHVSHKSHIRRTVISTEAAEGFTAILMKIWQTISKLIVNFLVEVKKRSDNVQALYKTRSSAYQARLRTFAAANKPDGGTVEMPSRKIEEMVWFVGYAGVDWKPSADLSSDDIIKHVKAGVDKCPAIFKENMAGFVEIYKIIATTLNNPDLPKQYATGFDAVALKLYTEIANEIKKSVPAFSNADVNQLIKDIKSGKFWHHFTKLDKSVGDARPNLNLPETVRIKMANFGTFRDFLNSIARDTGKVIELVSINNKLIEGQQEIAKAMTNFNGRLKSTGQEKLQPSHRELMRLCSNTRVVSGAFIIMAKRCMSVTDNSFNIASRYVGGDKKKPVQQQQK